MKTAHIALGCILVLAEPAVEKNCEVLEAHPLSSLPALFRESGCCTLATLGQHTHFAADPELPSTLAPISATGEQHYGYDLEFQCPACGSDIGHLCDAPSNHLTPEQAMLIFADATVWCNCGWHGSVGSLSVGPHVSERVAVLTKSRPVQFVAQI
jgi:hypothetical protein